MTKRQYNEEMIEEVVGPLIGPLKSAVRRGQWDGVDGAKKYIQNDRISSLHKIYNIKMQKDVLATCFKHMAKAAEDSQEWIVMREFANSNPDTVIHCITKYPELFENHNLVKYCMQGLDQNNQKKMRKLIPDNM